VLDKSLFDSLLAHLVQEHSSADWDEKAQRFIAESRRSIGGLLLATQPMDVTDDDRLKLLLQLVKEKGISWLPWTDEARSLQARTLLAREYLQGEWPDLADESLLQSLEDWLAPYLNDIRKLTDFKRLNMLDMLLAQLSWDKQQLLDKHLPLRWQTPSGNRYRIDYSVSPPVLAVKLQEMFGVLETPVILEGQLQLMIHLLSPAGRPLQITQDLKSFWENGYDQVRREMKGRYPKHAWPENPL